MKKIAILLPALVVLAGGCRKFLDEKPDKDLVVPSTLADLQALLDQTNVFNANYPYVGEMAADNFFVSTAVWLARPASERNVYTWGDEVFNENERNPWSMTYTVVYQSNVVLDELKKERFASVDASGRAGIRAQALFFRAMAFYELLQVFAKPYDKATASSDLGIALRLDSDFNEGSRRTSVQEGYDQVVADLEEATPNLPLAVPFKTRPSRAAGYALLARVHLAMEAYEKAGAYADSALQGQSSLLDYNSLNAAAANPVPLFNGEVIFHSIFLTTSLLNLSGKVDTVLYRLYDANDRRKAVFYTAGGDFKGSYDGSVRLFNGLATNELYLTRAECRARAGATAAALQDLNTLLAKRWKTGAFVPLAAGSAAEALEKILTERRKELAFRGLRWTDLRRLNRDPRFAKTLVRVVDNKTYTLPPNDRRYVFPLPELVIRMTGMPQNPR